MIFGFLGNNPWVGGLGTQPNKGLSTSLNLSSTLIEPTKQRDISGIKLWGWFSLPIVPWVINAVGKIQVPSTVNKDLKRCSQRRQSNESASESFPIRFRPYVSKVPWHSGPRALLSQLFPRYGHYCGPNWSSGKNGGSPIWDRRPIDWLDFCCYCHDIGYDTHDQAELLKADLAFLECLEKPNMKSMGDAHISHLYKQMCITGLKNILIPYRQNLLKLQSGQSLFDFEWLGNVKWRGWNQQASVQSYVLK